MDKYEDLVRSIRKTAKDSFKRPAYYGKANEKYRRRSVMNKDLLVKAKMTGTEIFVQGWYFEDEYGTAYVISTQHPVEPIMRRTFIVDPETVKMVSDTD